MVGSDPCASSTWALAAPLIQAAVPPPGYAPLLADKEDPRNDQWGRTSARYTAGAEPHFALAEAA